MSLYKDSGVDIEMGDECSALAYKAAKATFSGRKGMIGEPVVLEGGFTGMMDFGDFYLVQNEDGVGSKILVAQQMGRFDTLGHDLVAMVADDAICIGAETVSLTNTIDTNKVDKKVIGELMAGLQKACLEQKIVIPGGEIAEMPDLVKSQIWNACALGIVGKKKVIRGENLKKGDKIIGLYSPGFRSNGFSLVRYVLQKKFGPNYVNEKVDSEKSIGMTWGEAILAPCVIYSGALLKLLGRYGEEPSVEIKAIAHITGGGLPGNIPRVLNGKGVYLDELFSPYEPMTLLQKYGEVTDEEAYQVWNMGIGMVLVSNEFEKIQKSLMEDGIRAQVMGEITESGEVVFKSQGAFKKGEELRFRIEN